MSDGQLSNYVAAVEEENDMLRERVRQLEELLWISVEVPLLFGLSGKEGGLLNLLMSRPLLTKEQALDCLYFDRPNDTPELKIINVFICKLRRKLSKFGVTIDTAWGRGYSMSGESKAKVKEYMNQYKNPVAA